MATTARVRLAVVTTAVLSFGAAAPATAQREGYSYVSYAGSDVALVSRSEDDTTARPNTPVVPGDRLATGSSSRAEVVLADGTIVRLDVRTDVRFDRLAGTWDSDDDRNLVWIDRGALAVEVVATASSGRATRVDTNDVTVVLLERGLYRVEAGRRGTEVYVISGRAEVSARSGRVELRDGRYAFASGSEDIEVESAEEPRDRFARFVEERRERTRRVSSASYVSSDYGYDYANAEFDTYGSWVYASSWNRWCWQPRVSAGWRPYTSGYWRWTPAGLTWVSYEPWGWLPYHYGNWSWDASFGWCWLPDVFYSPAWVYWTYSPGWVGWCPTGYYDTYYRSTRTRWGWEPGARHALFSGRIDLTRIDPRGWSFLASNRLGSRFDWSRDVVSHDRAGFRRGDTALVESRPLRIDRGSGPISTSVQNAVRRAFDGDGARGAGAISVNEGLTGIFRRESVENRAVREELTRAGRDGSPLRPTSPESIGSTRRADPSAGARGDGRPSDSGFARRDSTESWRRPGSDGGGTTRVVPDRSSGSDASPSRGGGSRVDSPPRPADDSWRSGGATGSRTGADPGTDRPARRDDAGWRAPSRGSGDGSRGAGGDPPRATAGDAPRPVNRDAWRDSAPRSSDAPRREAPAPRAVESAPRSEPAPRAAEPRASEAPAPRRSEERRFDAPQRYEAPAPRRYEAPARHEAPAPRYEAPARRSDAPSSPRYEAPAPHREAAPRYEAPPAPRHENPAPRGGESSSGRRSPRGD